MMIGSYPCCDGPLMIAMPERTPAYCREDCPHCGVTVWHKLSRVDPTSWTETDFLAEHDIDEATKQITRKVPMSREEGAAKLREHYREEGRAARKAGTPIADCPYTPAAPPDSKWGVQSAVEWLKGWHE